MKLLVIIYVIPESIKLSTGTFSNFFCSRAASIERKMDPWANCDVYDHEAHNRAYPDGSSASSDAASARRGGTAVGRC